MNEIKFKETVVKVPHDVLENSKTNVKFYFTGDKSEIAHVHLGCSCTSGLIIGDDYIQVTYNDGGLDNGAILSVVRKKIRVYLNDGEHLYIEDSEGFKSFNPNKKHIDLEYIVRITK